MTAKQVEIAESMARVLLARLESAEAYLAEARRRHEYAVRAHEIAVQMLAELLETE